MLKDQTQKKTGTLLFPDQTPVEIKSKSGPKQVLAVGFGRGQCWWGRFGWEESLYNMGPLREDVQPRAQAQRIALSKPSGVFQRPLTLIHGQKHVIQMGGVFAGVHKEVVFKKVVLAGVPQNQSFLQKVFPCSATLAEESYDF